MLGVGLFCRVWGGGRSGATPASPEVCVARSATGFLPGCSVPRGGDRSRYSRFYPDVRRWARDNPPAIFMPRSLPPLGSEPPNEPPIPSPPSTAPLLHPFPPPL